MASQERYSELHASRRCFGPTNFTVLAVWSKPNPGYRYVEAVVRAVHLYRSEIVQTPTVMTGDFNSNRIWDGPHPREANNSALVRNLAALRLDSCYHSHINKAHREETRPTLHFQRKFEKSYHIDHCFVPQVWLPAISAVEVGSCEARTQYSDH